MRKRKLEKVKGIRKDPWVPRDWDTRTHLKKEHHEFVRTFNGYRCQPGKPSNGSNWVPLSNVKLPDKIDWGEQGLVTGVKNQ
ncbi:hypothetical protein AVEN_24089-1, partial [Araneus ventricosus]